MDRRQSFAALGALVLAACRSNDPTRSETYASATPDAPPVPRPSAKPASSDDPRASPPDGSAGHVLVVGGTGMLAEVTLTLARRGHPTTVIARGQRRLDSLTAQGEGRVHPLQLDYTDHEALLAGLEEAIAQRGPLTMVVAWVHSSAPEAPLAIARRAAASHSSLRYVHVLGSAADNPSTPDPDRRARFEALDGLTYQEVILGFVVEDGDSRWLTDPEIAAGVLAAIDDRSPRHIVGTTRPWSARP